MSEVRIVLSVTTYFLVVTLLLGMMGLGGSVGFTVWGGEAESSASDKDQSLGVAVLECLVTIFSDCSKKTTTKVFSGIESMIRWTGAYLSFFFQLLTFQLPIPIWLNALIVLPGATTLAYVGIRLGRGGG
jgi:hypothetical protein